MSGLSPFHRIAAVPALPDGPAAVAMAVAGVALAVIAVERFHRREVATAWAAPTTGGTPDGAPHYRGAREVAGMLLTTVPDTAGERWLTAVTVAVVGSLLLVLANWALRRAIRRVLPRLASSDRVDAQRLETVATLGRRFLIALLGTIIAWQALSVFPSTQRMAETLLASSAVLALIVGFAVTIPLSNIGAGVLLGVSQPVRLGDRTTVDGEAGTVERITLIYTVLRNDLGLAVYIPNSRMAQAIIVNRTLGDARVLAVARLPMRLDGDVATARRLIMAAVETVEPRGELETTVVVVAIEAEVAWLAIETLAPDGTRRGMLEAALREAGLGALGGAGLLPDQEP